MKQIPYLFIACSILCFCSCISSSEEESGGIKELEVNNIQEVEVEMVKMVDFEADILSNGKLESARFADVYWKVDGDIISIEVENGTYVDAGTTLARLDDEAAIRNEKSSSIDLAQAKMQMMDVLIGQGLDPNNMSEVSEHTLELIKIKSGYAKMELSHEQAAEYLANCTLRAPISGLVANVSFQGRTRNNTGKAFCRIIDKSAMNVRFAVIESELLMLKKGQKVVVTPFSNPEKEYTGKITAINPVVNSNGMVEVTAQIPGSIELYDGMGVNVHIKNMAGKKTAVPKSAVVLRSGKPVVFVANNGKAEWRYVTTTLESETQYAVTDGVAVGDSIIVSGNTDLAHNSEISIKQ
ncbi:MAG: efflux RND transporter periplasmic adaptor subunit [Bacteroidales bacterium]|nr:efflux RND transporter periplasmic adaptor subunit [Bacteroidales bacterium]